MPVLIYQIVKLVVFADVNLYQKQCQCSHHLPETPAVTTVSYVGIPRPFSFLVSVGSVVCACVNTVR